MAFGGFGGPGQPVPKDLIGILVALFVTFSLQFFEGTALIPALLRLTPAVFRGFVWQVVTYPAIGWGASGLWFLLELLILFWFGRDVFWRLGRQRFWLLLVRAAVGAALVAVVVQVVQNLAGVGATGFAAFQLMQGQRILLAIVIAAFATLWGEATILLFFVLPVKARWFLWLEILFAFKQHADLALRISETTARNNEHRAASPSRGFGPALKSAPNDRLRAATRLCAAGGSAPRR